MLKPTTSPTPERLRITKGRLGPLVAPFSIEPRPLTVLIGPQGSGKSLAAQMLYFFRDLTRLAQYAEAATAPAKGEKALSASRLLKAILDGLRSGDGYFSPFLEDGTAIEWGLEDDETVEGFSIRKSQKGKTRLVTLTPHSGLRERVAEARKANAQKWTGAIFVPTERTLYSELVAKPLSAKLFEAPSTYTFFANEMEAAKKTFATWDSGEPDTEEGRQIKRIAYTALAGEVVLVRDTWMWKVVQEGQKDLLLNIDMASSGQKANWPLVVIAQMLFSWRKSRRVAEGTTVYVEEPEIHLHPAAQWAMVEILAMLVRNGFRVVLTTHSLTVLYVINNLVQAGRIPRTAKKEGLPPLASRLKADDVEVILFQRGGHVRSLVNRESGFISEAELGDVASDLHRQMNQIARYLPE